MVGGILREWCRIRFDSFFLIYNTFLLLLPILPCIFFSSPPQIFLLSFPFGPAPFSALPSQHTTPQNQSPSNPATTTITQHHFSTQPIKADTLISDPKHSYSLFPFLLSLSLLFRCVYRCKEKAYIPAFGNGRYP